MPFSERHFAPIEEAGAELEKPSAPDFSRMSAVELEGYKAWKESVPPEIRAMVEGHLLGKKVRIDKDGMPTVSYSRANKIEVYSACRR